jgi:hypothetical protein
MNHRCRARYVDPATNKSRRCKGHHGNYPELLRVHRWSSRIRSLVLHWDAYGNRIER